MRGLQRTRKFGGTGSLIWGHSNLSFDLGVITKVDAVSAKGIRELGLILNNITMPLKLKYFGVINPEVEATSFDCSGTDFAVAREAEEDKLAQLFP